MPRFWDMNRQTYEPVHNTPLLIGFFPGKSRNLKRRWHSRARAECAFDAMNELVMCLSHRVDNMTEYRLGLLRHTTSYYHVVYRKALSPRRDMLITANALPICCTVRLKTRDWKTQHQTAELVDARRHSFIHIRLLWTVKPQLYTKIKQSACLKYIKVNTYFGTTFWQ